MTNLIEILVIPAVSVGAYIFASKHLTKFFMNGGKTPEQIVAMHKNDSYSRYQIKYPEADIKTSKHLILAFGFVFAFASSIYAFSIMGEKQTYNLSEPLVIEGDFEIVPPNIDMSKEPEKIEEKKISTNLEIEIVEKVQPPSLEEEKKEVKKIVTNDIVIQTHERIDDNGEIEEKDFFIVVEQMPTFKGCEGLKDDALNECTNQKIHSYSSKVDYPQIAIDNDIQGKVYVSFIVNKKGEITNVELLNSVDKILDRAALKHFKNMPNMKPGLQRGKPVRVKYQIPIDFRLGS